MHKKINKRLFADRKRTNLLNHLEQRLITYLVPRIPSWISPNNLSAIGLFGSVLILASFLLAKHISTAYLLVAILGFLINWLGDSMDGRVAYYRKIPRKWYGFSLDIIMDWISTVLIGTGYLAYVDGRFVFLAYAFVVLYGWSMIIAQLRYKITDIYTIDAGLVGPTEIRIIISFIIILEVIFPNSINYLVMVICSLLFLININDTRHLLKLGDERDIVERKIKSRQKVDL